MNLTVFDDKTIYFPNFKATQNENEVTEIEIQVPKEYEEFNKKIVFLINDEIRWDIIQGNKYTIKKSISKYKEVNFYIWLTKGDKDYRTEEKTLVFNRNVDASDQITEEEIKGVNTVVDILDKEIIKVNELELRLLALIENINDKLENGEFNGKDGKDGKDALINGQNTINIKAGENIKIEQNENELEISSTGGGGGQTDIGLFINENRICMEVEE